jgi:hypothetical protein
MLGRMIPALCFFEAAFLKEMLRRILVFILSAQLCLLGLTPEGYAARQTPQGPAPVQLRTTGVQPKEGYVKGASWFRTHPPFYQRMVDSRREIMFLSPRLEMLVQTSAFEQMKKELAPIAAVANKEEMGRPSLKITREQGCEPPKKLEYKPGQPIEELCAAPTRTLTEANK